MKKKFTYYYKNYILVESIWADFWKKSRENLSALPIKFSLYLNKNFIPGGVCIELGNFYVILSYKKIKA